MMQSGCLRSHVVGWSGLWVPVRVLFAHGTFIHRDLHPANVLFHKQRLSGIVDWVHGCWGPLEADVSRCRVEIALLAGMDAADRYLNLCTDFLPTYDSRWDALVALELSPWVEDIVECFSAIGSNLTEASVTETLNRFVGENLWFTSH